MTRCGTLVIGPAGSGKSTFCQQCQAHCEATGRAVHVINLDPAAEHFSYPVAADIRDLVSLNDVMSEMKLGPNGGLIYCMEYLVDNMDWLEDTLEELGPEECVLFDCPGQIELYSHVPAMSQIVLELQRLGFRLATCHLLDSQFVADIAKFISGVLCCLSAMTALELPHINVLSKCDLLPSRRSLEEFLDADARALSGMLIKGTRSRFYRLNSAICDMIDEWSMVQFMPLDPRDPDTLELIIAQLDNATQYYEDVEPKHLDNDDATNEASEDLGGLGGGNTSFDQWAEQVDSGRIL